MNKNTIKKGEIQADTQFRIIIPKVNPRDLNTNKNPIKIVEIKFKERFNTRILNRIKIIRARDTLLGKLN